MAPEKTPELKAKAGDKVGEDEDETRSEPQPAEDEDIKPADHVTEDDEGGRKGKNKDGGKEAREEAGKPEDEENGDGINEDGENSVNKENVVEVDEEKTPNEDEERTANEDEERTANEDVRKTGNEGERKAENEGGKKPGTRKRGKGTTKKGGKTTNEDETKSANNKGEKRTDEDVTKATKQEDGRPENEDGRTPASDNKGLPSDLANTISPVRELRTALQERREDERRAFDELIGENVRLQRRLTGAEAKCQQLSAKCEVKDVELEAERSRATRLEAELAEMKREMTLLIRAAKRAGVIGSAQRKDNDDDPEREKSGLRGPNGGSSSPTRPGERSVWKRKVAELEDRLLRLTEEDERKSRRLIALERELLDKTRYVEALEQHVTDDVRQSLSELRREPATPEMVFTTMGMANNVVYAGRPEPYSYKNNLVQDSAVCVIS